MIDIPQRTGRTAKIEAIAFFVILPLILFAQPKVNLKGSGATFPQPIYAKWFNSYQQHNPAVEFTYEAIGSEAGIRQLLAGKADFGASDNPDILHEIGTSDQGKYLFVASVIGAVVPIVNLPGLPSDINLTSETLAGIYLGKITKWNDPVLARSNPNLTLPDLPVIVVHRADGSGTSYAWTDYLSKTNPEWKAQVGIGSTPRWRVGRAANGNDGVAKLVKELGGSIGYVEFIYALRNHLGIAKVRNEKGRFLAADLDTITAAAASASTSQTDAKASLVNAPAANAYPITSFTWFVIPRHIEDDAKRKAINGFLTWMLGSGQKQVAALGYVALPPSVIAAEETILTKIN